MIKMMSLISKINIKYLLAISFVLLLAMRMVYLESRVVDLRHENKSLVVANSKLTTTLEELKAKSKQITKQNKSTESFVRKVEKSRNLTNVDKFEGLINEINSKINSYR